MTIDPKKIGESTLCPTPPDGKNPASEADVAGTAQAASGVKALQNAPEWLTTWLKAGVDLKLTGVSPICNVLLVALTLASKSGVTRYATRALTFCFAALAVPATAALLLIGAENFWPSGVDAYTSLIRDGFSIRKSADDAVAEDHATIDYYGFYDVDLNSRDVNRRKYFHVLLVARQRAVFTLDPRIVTRHTHDGCPTEQPETATVELILGGNKLSELQHGSGARTLALDQNWWDQNEADLRSRGQIRVGEKTRVPLRVSFKEGTPPQVSTDGRPCLTFSPLITVEVYKQRFEKIGNQHASKQ
jgi:hypothetical protein